MKPVRVHLDSRPVAAAAITALNEGHGIVSVAKMYGLRASTIAYWIEHGGVRVGSKIFAIEAHVISRHEAHQRMARINELRSVGCTWKEIDSIFGEGASRDARNHLLSISRRPRAKQRSPPATSTTSGSGMPLTKRTGEENGATEGQQIKRSEEGRRDAELSADERSAN